MVVTLLIETESEGRSQNGNGAPIGRGGNGAVAMEWAVSWDLVGEFGGMLGND